ncbi:MAG TPA: universal stress protein [Kofleriaceae bacterium]|jgi:nucleotide-binding universal stress UspA family protein|nr:universal stress protein [Kofleriaceae bacterium]
MVESLDRILAVTDLSLAGDIAVQEASQRARQQGSRLGVVHAIPTLDAIRPLFPHRLADEAVLASQLPLRAELTLRAQLDSLGVTGDYDLIIEQGTMADVTLNVVERWKPTMLVVGSPVDGAVGTIGLIRHATTPVLVARTSRASARVVVGTDFSDPSFPAVRAAAAAAASIHGGLVLVHAIEVNPIALYGMMLPVSETVSGDAQGVMRQRLEDVLQRLGVTAQVHVCIGPPGPALLQAAAMYQAGLLVVGTHGRTGVTRFLLGSVAEAVIHHAPCSVLVTRLEGPEADGSTR